MSKKALVNAMKNVYRTAERNTTRNIVRFVLTWVILALREEGFGQTRLKRVIDRVLHYSERYVDGDLNMEQMMRHNTTTTGIEFAEGKDGRTEVILHGQVKS